MAAVRLDTLAPGSALHLAGSDLTGVVEHVSPAMVRGLAAICQPC
jgi:hypothetical protein